MDRIVFLIDGVMSQLIQAVKQPPVVFCFNCEYLVEHSFLITLH